MMSCVVNEMVIYVKKNPREGSEGRRDGSRRLFQIRQTRMAAVIWSEVLQRPILAMNLDRLPPVPVLCFRQVYTCVYVSL